MKTAYVVAGLGYGDEGKGATVDFICRTRDVGMVIRYNGGSQAAHNVVAPDGRHHTFAQFGSGMFVPGVHTHLSRFMLVDPFNMAREADHLERLGLGPWGRITIDPKCLIITPFQKALNRIRCQGTNASCGMGIGETRGHHLSHGDKVLFAGDLRNWKTATEKLNFIQQLCCEATEGYGIIAKKMLETHFNIIWEPCAPSRIAREMEFLSEYVAEMPRVLNGRFDQAKDAVFEGAQGVLLDENHGEQGFNTWTNTTFGNALKILDYYQWDGAVQKIGVMRTYHTRHGDGPFKTESKELADKYPEPHNCNHGPQGRFRIGHFDPKLFKRAIEICGGVDGLALNHIDVNPYFFTRERREIEKLILIKGFGTTADDREWAARIT